MSSYVRSLVYYLSSMASGTQFIVLRRHVSPAKGYGSAGGQQPLQQWPQGTETRFIFPSLLHVKIIPFHSPISPMTRYDYSD